MPIISNNDRATLDPKVVARIQNSGSARRYSSGGGPPAALLVCALLLPGSLVGNADASSQLAPFKGSASIVTGRNVAGPEGASYRLPSGIVVSLSPNCEGSVVTQPQMLALKSGQRTPTYSVFVSSGRVDVDIPDANAGAVLIAAPASVRIIAQKGQVTALAAGRNTYAYSPNQSLLVSQKERLSTLAPGVIRQFVPETAPVDLPALAAPTWQHGRHVWLAIPNDAQISDFSWSAISEARTYLVQLRRQDSGQTIADFTAEAPHVGATLPRLAAGNYQLVVRAVDKLGLPGLESTPFRIQVVGVDVPPGANLKPDARIELHPTQTIQLNNADGLSLTRSNDHAKRPASEPVGVTDGKPTPVLIHDDDSATPNLVWLLPSKVPVLAVAGPKWVVWPQQSVALEVQWSDAFGNRLAPDIEPVVNVFVGIEPVDVVWDKRPELWRATLGPQPGKGPWVVRLEVRDQQGGLLARDFVEVQKRTKRYKLSVASYADLNTIR